MINLYIHKKKFRDKTILIDTSLKIMEGGFYIITGPSGVGKSSLLNIIGLLDGDFYGDYMFYDEKIYFYDCNKTQELRRSYFGYIFQDSLINERQDLIRNILCSVEYSKQKEKKKTVDHFLSMVGLHFKNGCSSVLSGGEKQRLALARALIKQPKILLADEPTASLDKENKKIIMSILNSFNNEGGTIIMVTHDLELINNNMEVITLSNC
ncbi:ABC transporter ATP-binding protein [Citrobacter rodentium]|jgi:ABC-type antimicrobial peptide transport system, ATPase component|uniref:AatC, ATP binding protein of ABC transporter n=2 Tax=Citrobacter rodentium TaxID=67825 RepID=D2TK00_CITRI|nr:ATP-binding cassette domain-containing protein [Citrobacter rodentium]KIQ50639.1 macrolide ABC transporter ATP-binding protein [Citrobacter rodentium]QBY31580.1 ATP-binding cassette domain-containing protein [Citrobacter rodentium]UHO31061.1 ATP-binding cassette domain-containing protein [Citrobacter rodentium NBRC 105723 = DSM 16636]CBG87130.1 AatC, ATP binding protein of ABC transporter [Citrobacter rodentium ICC168]HAT8013573.1 ABC transporter ATP-binding protein [Citrobacter rodentium N